MRDLKTELIEITQRAKPYLHLAENPDFRKFKEDIIDTRLASYLEAALTADLRSEEGKRIAVESLFIYQELKHIFDAVFKNWEFVDKEARAKLKELD